MDLKDLTNPEKLKELANSKEFESVKDFVQEHATKENLEKLKKIKGLDDIKDLFSGK